MGVLPGLVTGSPQARQLLPRPECLQGTLVRVPARVRPGRDTICDTALSPPLAHSLHDVMLPRALLPSRGGSCPPLRPGPLHGALLTCDTTPASHNSQAVSTVPGLRVHSGGGSEGEALGGEAPGGGSKPC